MLTLHQLQPVQELGQGGFGQTTLVKGEQDYYVLKRLKKSAISEHGDTVIRLFQDESQYLAQLGNHPQIPALIESDVDDDGPWILQEYIPGDNLEQIAARHTFTEADIIDLLKSILPVVDYIHQCKTIHRDIKPANLIQHQGQYYLVDFGASKVLTETNLRKTGTTIGSAEFIAPEQARGKAVPASDLYSLGVTCAHLLTGVSPFDLVSLATGQWCWRDYLTHPVSEGFGLILDKMLEYGLERRFNTAEAVLNALEHIDQQEIARRRAAAFDREYQRKKIRRWVRRGAIGVGASAILVGAGFGVSKLSQVKITQINLTGQTVENLFNISVKSAMGFAFIALLKSFADRARDGH
jgi:serine/threonine protein kinase